MIAAGTISAEVGERLLELLEPGSNLETGASPMLEAGEISAQIRDDQTLPPDWRKYWIYPAVIGGVLIASGLGYIFLFIEGIIGWGWLFVTWAVLALGMVLLLLGWLMRNAAWLHLRIKDGNTRLYLGLPLPLRWIVWGIGVARRFVPQLADYVTDDLLEALAEASARAGEAGFKIEVQEAKGEQVYIYYG
jgi:hypothetical protein